MHAHVWRPSPGPMPRLQRWPCVVASGDVPPLQTPRRLAGGPLPGTGTARRSVSGAPGIGRPGAPAGRRRRAQGGRGAGPPAERLAVRARATRPPAAAHGPATRWRRAAMPGGRRDRARGQARRRATRGRPRAAAARTPPRRVAGRKRPALARARGDRSGHACRCAPAGRLVRWGAEPTGRPLHPRPEPPPPAPPGTPAPRQPAARRPGGRGCRASGVGPTGPGRWPRGPTRTREACAAPLAHAVRHRPDRPRAAWGVAHLPTPWRLEGGRRGAAWCERPWCPQARPRGAPRRAGVSAPPHQPVGPCPPQQGAWRPQVAWGGGGRARRLLQRGACGAVEDGAARRLADLDADHTPEAPP